MYCAHCGNEINEKDKFCANCGAAIKTKKAKEKKDALTSQAVMIICVAVTVCIIVLALMFYGIFVNVLNFSNTLLEENTVPIEEEWDEHDVPEQDNSYGRPKAYTQSHIAIEETT